MARIRNIKPEFFTSEAVAELPFRARLTWLGLWTHADNHGRARDNAKLIKAAVWPLEDEVGLREIDEDLAVLAARGRIVRYEVDGRRYLMIANWAEHQYGAGKGDPKFPGPDAGSVLPPSTPDTRPVDNRLRDMPSPPRPASPQTSGHGLDEPRTNPDDSGGIQGSGDIDSGDRGQGGGRARARPSTRRPHPAELNRDAHSDHARRLIDDFAATCKARPSATVRRRLGPGVDELLAEGWPEQLIAGALACWRDKGLDPAVFPSVANEFANRNPAAPGPARPSTTDQRVAAAQALKDLYADPDQPSPLQITTGR